MRCRRSFRVERRHRENPNRLRDRGEAPTLMEALAEEIGTTVAVVASGVALEGEVVAIEDGVAMDDGNHFWNPATVFTLHFVQADCI